MTSTYLIIPHGRTTAWQALTAAICPARIFYGLLLAVCVTFVTIPQALARATGPNIVVVLADDLGWSDSGAYGNDFIDTPSIDALASAGVRLTRFYTDPVCSPTRAAIQTGRYAASLGMTDFIMPPRMTGGGEYIRGHWRPFEKVDTPLTRHAIPDARTIGDALRDAGYRTGYFGKWHLGFEAGDLPADKGYDVAHIYTAHALDDGTRTLDAVTREVAEFLDDTRSRPFFLFLSPTQPHIPLDAPAELIAKYRERARERSRALPSAAYAALVEELDRFVGRIDSLLAERQLRDSTVFIFLSDNGGLETFDLDLGGRVTSNAPLRGEKGTILEGGIRTPFIARWPGHIEASFQTDTLAAAVDLFPTLSHIAGLDSDTSSLDGRNLLPALRGESPGGDRRLFFHYPHYHHGRPASAVVTQRWKLIEYLDDDELALYDLNADPGEAVNLAAKETGARDRLHGELRAWREAIGAKLPTPNPSYDPARAGEWWHAGLNQPIDRELLRRVFKIDVQ